MPQGPRRRLISEAASRGMALRRGQGSERRKYENAKRENDDYYGNQLCAVPTLASLTDIPQIN